MGRLLLKNANFLDGDAKAKAGTTIVIAGERIQTITAGEAEARPDDRVVDLGGRTVMPGMVHCHYHATYHQLGAIPVPPGMEAPPPLQALRAARNVRLALHSGFTAAVSAGAPYAIDASLKIAIEEGLIEGPRFVAGSRDVSTTGHTQDKAFPWYWEPGVAPAYVRCDGPDAFRRAVREEIKRGAEIIKMFLTAGHGVRGDPAVLEISRPELASAIDAAHERGVKVRAHIANREAILLAVELGMDVVDHGDGLDEVCIDKIVKAGAFFAPSLLYVSRRWETLPEGAFKDQYRAPIDRMLEMLPAANSAGVKLVLGDDHGAVPLKHGCYADELELYVREAGIPPLDVIRWATKHGAELMGRGDDLGTLQPGKLADLLVIDGDPLADIAILKDVNKILAIVKGGAFVKDELGRFTGKG